MIYLLDVDPGRCSGPLALIGRCKLTGTKLNILRDRQAGNKTIPTDEVGAILKAAGVREARFSGGQVPRRLCL